MIVEGADEDEVALFELISSVLYDVGSVSADYVEQFVGIVCVERVLVAIGSFGYLVLVKDSVRFPDTVVQLNFLPSFLSYYPHYNT